MNDIIMTYKRIIWLTLLYFFIACMFSIITTWLFYSWSQSNGKPEPLLVVMAILTLVVAVFFLILTVIRCFLRLSAITIDNSTLIIKNFKTTIVPFSDIKDIKYRVNSSSRARILLGLVIKSGTLFIYLNDNSVIKVPDLKDVHFVCNDLKRQIFINNQNTNLNS